MSFNRATDLSTWTDDERLLCAEIHPLKEISPQDQSRIARMHLEIEHGFAALSSIGSAVSVFGSARLPESDPWYEAACTLGRRFVEEGYAVITGGGPGIMEAANRGAHEADGTSVGLSIELPEEQDTNKYVNLEVHFHYFFARKLMFIRYATGFVTFPGGFGTLDELTEALTLIQTAKIRHFPLILAGVDYWKPLVDWLSSRLVGDGLISPSDLDLMFVTDDLEEIIELIHGYHIEQQEHSDTSTPPRRVP